MASIRSSPRIDARHDHVYFQMVSGNGGPLITPRARADRGSRSTRRAFGAPHLVGNAAQDVWPSAGRRMRRRRSRSIPQPAPDIAWVAWLGAAVDPGQRAGAAVLSARARRQAAGRSAAATITQPRPHDGMAVRMVERRHAPWSSPQACATRRGWRNCMAHRFTAAGAKANSRSCWPSATRWCIACRLGRKDHRLCGIAHGRGRGGDPVDRDRC